VSRRIEEVHPELFHYTGFEGLHGILQTQQLWATHFQHLNDGAEVIEFRHHMPQVLRPVVAPVLTQMYQTRPAKRALMDRWGGLQWSIDEAVRAGIKSAYDVTFGLDGSTPFAEAYITSFCTAAGPRQAQHGLLSQWRCYGRNGGYAIVFDTAALSAAIGAEGARWPNTIMLGGDVVYSDATADEIESEFIEYLTPLIKGFAEWLDTDDRSRLDPMYINLLMVTSRFKHWGFSEEREVRIVTVPPNQLIIDEMKRRQEKVTLIPTYMRPGAKPIPTLHLFDDYRATRQLLPITRIIVGPGGDRAARVAAVQDLLCASDLDIPVTTSEIPYING
jgi:hypothetical protein